MARSSFIEDIFHIATELPWWLATAMGGGLFCFLKFYMPTRMSATHIATWQPMLSALAYGLLAICLLGAVVGIVRRSRKRSSDSMVAPGRGRRSKARLSLIEDLFAISTELPWWLVAPMGAGLFYAVKYYLPARLPSAISHGWAPLLSVLAYSLLAICLVGTAVGIFRRAQERQLYADQKSIRSIRSLSWNDFERLIAEAFRRQGYNANLSNSGPDGGVDVVLTRAGQTTLVQCKQWKTARVGVKPIRELAGVVATQKGATGLFVCSGSYTREARRFAERSKIELVDGYRLAEMMGLESPTAPSPNNDPPLSPIADLIEPAINANACPSCGAELVVRKARRGIKAGSSFIGCSGFPKCKYTRDR